MSASLFCLVETKFRYQLVYYCADETEYEYSGSEEEEEDPPEQEGEPRYSTGLTALHKIRYLMGSMSF